MLQESVYAKLALNMQIANSIKQSVYKNKPSKGIVQLLIITEKQFENIEYIVGQKPEDILDNTERLVII